MFHKIRPSNRLAFGNMKLWLGLAILLFSAPLCPAQEPNDTTLDNEEPIPIPVQDTENQKSLAAKTFVDDVFQSVRNSWGFSLSAYQAYTTDISPMYGPRESSGISAVLPRTFFNAGRKKSKFHVDIGAGYRYYERHRDLNSWDYYGDAQYSYQMSKRTSFQITNQLTSSFNDSWSFLSLYSPLHYEPSFSNEVLFNRQRITRNSLQAAADFRLTKKAQFGVFGGFNYYKYPQQNLRNSNAFDVGGRFEYEFTKWLHFSSQYSTYLNYVDEQSRDAQIHRLQLAGFDFRLSHSWSLSASGGVEYTKYQNRNRFGESVSGGIGYTSRNTMFSLTYQRGFTSAIGISRLMTSNIASAELGYRITPRISARLQGYYYRSTEQDYDGLLKTFSGGGGFEFVLLRDLFLSVNSFYQNQQARNFSVDGLGLNRFSAYAGLQYVWPSRKRSDYEPPIRNIQ